MAVEDKTMFEIYREADYNRSFASIFYTELEEHAREREIAKAMSGHTVFTGYLDDGRKDEAKALVQAIVDELNDMDEDEAGMSQDEIRGRLAQFLVDAAPT